MGELAEALGSVGFEGVQVVASFAPFLGASKEGTARRYHVRGVNMLGLKPAR